MWYFDIGEYLDYSNCTCKKKLFEKLIEECTKNIDEISLVKKKTLDKNENEDKYRSYVIYKVLFFIFVIIIIVIGIYFVYQKYVNHNKYDLPY